MNTIDLKNKAGRTDKKEVVQENKTVANIVKIEEKADNSISSTSKSETSKEGIKFDPIEPNITPTGCKQTKVVPNLENTLKLVEELHRRKLQRDRLIDTINTLETFEVELKDDADETAGNHFQGCKLIIEDDSRNQFSTKNPVIIQAVAQFVKKMCEDRLGEIEADIVLP
jgi:hypothetical protein